MRIKLFIFLLIGCGMLSAQTAPAGFSDRNERYHLQPNDVVDVQYRYTPEYNQTVTIHPDGFVTLPLVGDVKIGDLTLEQAHEALLTLASQRLNKPEIVVVLRDFEKPHFVVSGEVNTPGRFELRGRITVSEAIAMAGGFKAANAKHSQVLLLRRVNDTFGEAHVLNVKDFINSKDFSEDLKVQAGDMVVVPQNTISKVERLVKWVNMGFYANPMVK
jgi:polysaccharide export outer membrane protein